MIPQPRAIAGGLTIHLPLPPFLSHTCKSYVPSRFASLHHPQLDGPIFHILFPSSLFTTRISSSFYLSIFQSLLLSKISNSQSFHLSASLCLYSSITSVWFISLYLSITCDQVGFLTFRNNFVSAGRQKVRGKKPN